MDWWGAFAWSAGEWLKEWVPVVGPLGTLGIVGVAFVAYLQKVDADKRAQWWIRAEWAIGAALNDTDRQTREVGIIVLTDLGEHRLATKEDRALFFEVAEVIQSEVLDGLIGIRETETSEENEGEVTHGKIPQDRIAGWFRKWKHKGFSRVPSKDG